MSEDDNRIADERAPSDTPLTARKSRSAIEGTEALDLYVRQIVRNLAEMEKQVGLLREACAEREKLLREIE